MFGNMHRPTPAFYVPATSADPLTLRLSLGKLIPKDNQLAVSVNIFELKLANLFDKASGQNIKNCAAGFCNLPMPDFVERRLTVSFFLTTAGEHTPTAYLHSPGNTLSLPLFCLYRPGDDACKSKDMQIPLGGDSHQYPQDHYGFGLFATGSIEGIGVLGRLHPLYPRLAVDYSSLVDMDVVAHVDNKGTPGTPFYHVDISRPLGTRTFILATSLAPLMFVLLFFHLLFINPRTRQAPLLEFMVALSTTTFAVLPLRVVLVPADIEGLTLVDVFLTFGIVALLGLGLLRYARDLWFAQGLASGK